MSRHSDLDLDHVTYKLPHNVKIVLVPRMFIKRKDILKGVKGRRKKGLDGLIYSRKRTIYISHELNPGLRLQFLEGALPELLQRLRYSKAARQQYYAELDNCEEYTNLVNLLAVRRFK